MPYPRAGEDKSSYIARFMKSSEAQSDFPDEKQRLAVAYSMWGEKKNALPYGQEHPWPKAYVTNFIEPGVVFYQDLGLCSICGSARSCGNAGDACETEGETVLVKQEALAKMAKSFIGKPVINVQHKDVTPETIANGDADGIVTKVWLDDKAGWWNAEFLVWDLETQKNCESAAFSTSCAYEPTAVDETGGEYHNLPYHEEILDGEYTHLAIVTSPRYEGARIQLVNSKGGSMSWRFWEKGARKNAAPLDPKKEMVDVGGKQVSLQNLYDALPADEKPKYNDDTMLETPKGEKTLGELKKNYLDLEKKNAEALSGEHIKTSAPEDKGHGSHEESAAGSFQHEGSCDHCRHPGFNAKEEGDGEKKPLPDLRRQNSDSGLFHWDESKGFRVCGGKVKVTSGAGRGLGTDTYVCEKCGESLNARDAQRKNQQNGSTEGDPEEAAKKAEKAMQEKEVMVRQQAKEEEEKKNAADADAKAAEEKKNAEEKAKDEMRQAEEKAEKEKELANSRREAGRKSFASLRNARSEASSETKIMPISIDERLAKGKSKYGSPA